MEDLKMSEKRVYRRFSKEFKEEAVKLSMSTDKTQAQIANELGIDRKLLFSWRKDYKENPNKIKDLEKIKNLEKELKEVRLEREILKKAAAIFSQG
jgi:transposase